MTHSTNIYDTENEAVAKALGKGLPDHERPVFWGAALHDRQADEVARAAIAALDAHRASQAMTDPYTPTTEEVRTNYAMDYIHAVKGATPEDYIPKVREFDRWLAQHDAELRRQVAREIRAHAEHVDGPRGANALERAARIAEGPTMDRVESR